MTPWPARQWAGNSQSGDGAGRTPVASLKIEIEQQIPFASAEEEALLNLVRTSDCVTRALRRKIRPWGITATQYNVLRILRGAQPAGLTCSEIGSRMVTAEPDITRLLGRLKALKLIRQQHDRQDRRVVRTQISDAGLKLLAEMDPVIARAPQELLGHMNSENLGTLIRLLERARQQCKDASNNVGSRRSQTGRPG